MSAESLILGISCDYHDSAAALVADGDVVAAAEEERFSRIKHDSSLPVGAITACLEVAGAEAADIEQVVFYERPMTVLARYVASRQRMGPRGVRSFISDTPKLVSKNLMVGYRLRRALRDLGARRPPVVTYVDHHHSHAAAAFFPSPFDEATILTVDGIGEWATATIGFGSRMGTTMLEELRYPDSLGLLYSYVTAWCGFKPNDGEYKLMGLAPYGTPVYLDVLEAIARLGPDGQFEVDAKRLGWYQHGLRSDRSLEEHLGGPARKPGDTLTQRDADLAASVQRLTERAVLQMAARAHELTGGANLCMAGGVALNCVANGRLVAEGPFDHLWVQPAAGDAGSAVGAALALWHDVFGVPRRPRSGDGMRGSLLGPKLEEGVIRDRLDELRIAHQYFGETCGEAELEELAAGILDDGGVVAVARGRMEFGPRALGNRSLLGDPRNPTIRERMNREVKGRESFRPFAPAVLLEHVSDWFELDQPSPYMLVVSQAVSSHLAAVAEEPSEIADRSRIPRSTLPACTHVDGSARIQTVDRNIHPDFHDLIAAFHRRTGCPVVLNTSFNLAGEPIVNSVDEALRAAKLGGVDLLVLGRSTVGKGALDELDIDLISGAGNE